jgi:RHS repeat-associated protein
MNCVTNITWRTASGARLGGFAYEYDAVGRIVLRSHAIGSNAFDRVYAYDDLDRLSSDGGVTYTYDAAGNRTTRTENGLTTTYTLGVGDRLATWTGGSYTYDVAGNVTRIERDGRPTLDLTWNSQYQLVSVATNGVFAESYAYDALGRRVSTTTLEGTTRHVYDDNWQVVADVGTNGNVIASYVWGDGIDRLLAVKIGGASYYPLTDIQGTIWGYVDSQNNVVARWQYDAWGNVVDEDVSAPALAKLRYRFQCREWSAATGLVNFRMRWYDPETGRWLSKDPIGLSGGLNLYAFCSTSPINLCDIFGLCTTDDKNKSPFMTAGSVLIVTGGIIIAGVSNAAPPGPVGAAVVAGGWVVGGLMEAAGFVSTIIGVSRGERGPNWPKK